MNSRASSSPPRKLFAERTEHVISVEHRHQRWEVVHNGLTRPMIDWLHSRERAVDHALELAERLLFGGENVVLVVDGDERLLTRDDVVRPH